MLSIDRSILERNSPAFLRMREYAKYLDRLVVVVLNTGSKKYIKTGNLEVYPSNSRNKFFYYYDFLKLVKKNDLLAQVEIISAQDPYDTGVLACLVKNKKLKINIQEHMDIIATPWRYESLLNFFRYLTALYVLRRTDTIRAVSERINQKLIRKLKIDPKRITAAPVYTDPSQYKIGVRKKNGYIKLLMISRFVKQKNIFLALKVIKELKKELPTLRLKIVGVGPEQKKIAKFIERNALADIVEMSSWTNDPHKEYLGADALLLTSNYEGWGRTCVEALLCGCPVIMTDVGCAQEVVRHDYNGLISPVGDRRKLQENIKRFALDARLRQNLARNAPNSAKLPILNKNTIIKKIVGSL